MYVTALYFTMTCMTSVSIHWYIDSISCHSSLQHGSFHSKLNNTSPNEQSIHGGPVRYNHAKLSFKISNDSNPEAPFSIWSVFPKYFSSSSFYSCSILGWIRKCGCRDGQREGIHYLHDDNCRCSVLRSVATSSFFDTVLMRSVIFSKKKLSQNKTSLYAARSVHTVVSTKRKTCLSLQTSY